MGKKINFHLESGVSHPLQKAQNIVSKWLANVADAENKKIIQLNYIFCDDEYLLEINKKYLSHDYYTDIITFPYQEGMLLEGDLFISLDRVKENALQYSINFDAELRRVLVHGLLHLMGYTDKTEEDQQKMTEKENYYLELYEHNIHHE